VNAPQDPPSPLPSARGPLSELVRDLIASPLPEHYGSTLDSLRHSAGLLAGDVEDPLEDDDLQLALYLMYGLHYRSFRDVDPGWEWNPAILAIRERIETCFERSLMDLVSVPATAPEQVGTALFDLEVAADGPPISRYLERESSLDEFKEFVIHRSAYQLKEADPHSWAIPRLTGAPKTALLEVQFDEYGSGRPERMHSRLFAKTMAALGLENVEDAYLERLPGTTLATVNLMSFFGLHRRHRGAAVGHLAMFEMTSSKPNRGYGNGLRRLRFGEDATDFYDEHVEADAVHENIAAHDMAGGLAKADSSLTGDIMFGAAALLALESRFARRLLESWNSSESSLIPTERVAA
jgi:hypothetical protein